MVNPHILTMTMAMKVTTMRQKAMIIAIITRKKNIITAEVTRLSFRQPRHKRLE